MSQKVETIYQPNINRIKKPHKEWKKKLMMMMTMINLTIPWMTRSLHPNPQEEGFHQKKEK